MKAVKIQSIHLENYRQFTKQIIDFPQEKDKNIYIIEGKNGFGKSNIYNAITWCFFEKEEHKSEKNIGLPICNIKIFNDLKSSRSTTTSVKLFLETDGGKKVISRSVKTFKNDDDNGFYTDESKLSIVELIGTDWKESPYPDNVIGKILPIDMRHFFFIDGEKLRQLFENIESKQIKKSIFDLSQITLLQKAIDHLDKVKNSFRKDTKDEPDLGLFAEQLQEINERITSKQKELEKHLEQRDTAAKRIEELSRKIEESGDETVKVIEAERKEIKELISLLEKQIESLKYEYLKYLFDMAPPIFAHKAIKKTIKVISDLEQSGQLPPKIQETFLEELLEKNKCICGADLSSEAKSRDNLVQLLENARYSRIARATIETRFTLKGCLNKSKDFDDRSMKYESDILKLEKQYDEKITKLKGLDDKYGKVDIEHINQLHQFRMKFISALKELSSQIGLAKQHIHNDEEEYKSIERMYNKELSKLEKYKEVREKIEICGNSIEELEKIKEKLMGEVKEETRQYTKDYFTKIISDKEFDDIIITNDYRLSVVSEGLEAIFNLSAAETLCLGYSFMAALRKASAFLAPIVIDTPIAKIDKEYRINVAKWFKDALHDAQVILLVTNTEYTSDFKNEIMPHVAKEYRLTHNATNKCSEVVEYGK